MMNGKKSENTYLWAHPTLGEQYVRCGGTAYSLPDGKGWILRGYHYNVTEDILRQKQEQAKIDALNDEKKELFGILESMSKVYNSMHSINIPDNTSQCFHCSDSTSKWSKNFNNASEALKKWAMEYPSMQYRELVSANIDLQTLPKRLHNKNSFYFDFINFKNLWIRFTFTVIQADADGYPTCVIITTQNIDEEKRREEALLLQSNTDGMTHLFNKSIRS